GRRGGLGLHGARSAPSPCGISCHGGRARAWRRYDRAGSGRGQNRYRSVLDLCSGRQALRRRRAAGGDVLLLARSPGEHPQAHLTGYAGILQADAYDGYNKLYLADRKPGPVQEAACWVHARRPFFAMADIEENARRKAWGKKEIPLSPIAIEVV